VTDINLEPGDLVLLYTDGVSERFNMDKTPYGEERLVRQMERTGSMSPGPSSARSCRTWRLFPVGVGRR